jgi:hypothetical protein
MLQQSCYFYTSSLQLLFGAKNVVKTNSNTPLVSFYVLEVSCFHYHLSWSHVHSKSSHYVGFYLGLPTKRFSFCTLHDVASLLLSLICASSLSTICILSSLEIEWNKRIMYHWHPSFLTISHKVEIKLNSKK